MFSAGCSGNGGNTYKQPGNNIFSPSPDIETTSSPLTGNDNNHVNNKPDESQSSHIPSVFWELFSKKQYKQASAILEKKLAENPGNFEIMRFLADSYYLDNETGKALDLGKELYEMEPGNPDINILLGNIYFYRKKAIDEAIPYYEKACKMRPGDRSAGMSLMETYFLKKRYREIIDFLEEYIIQNPKDKRAFALLGASYVECGRLIEAQNMFKQSLKYDPENAVTHILLAEAYMDNKQFDKSMQMLEKAKKLDPSNKDIYLDIGEIYYWRGDYITAEKLINKSLSMDPSYFSPYNELGNLYFLQKKYDLAEKYHKMALERFPEYHDAYRGLGRVYKAQGRYGKAEKAFKKALELKPFYYGEIYVYLAELYELIGDPEQQKKSLLQGIKTDPHYPEPYRLLKKYYTERQMQDKVEEIGELMKKNCPTGKATRKTGQ